MKLTVIGLGAMGSAVARRLVDAGFDTTVHDVDAEAVTRLVDAGARAWDPRSEAAADDLGDVVLTSLPNDEIVQDVVLGGDLLPMLAGGALVEMSTVLPATVERIAERAAEHDVHVVDSPVSNGPAEALRGAMTLLIGAGDRALARAQPVLDALGTIEQVGDVGHGKAVKLVNNLMAAGNVVVAAEAFTLGTHLGLDPRQLFDVLSRTGGRSFHFLKRWPLALDDDFDARWSLHLAEKDVRLGVQLAHENDYAMPAAGTIHQIFELGRAKGLGDQDVVAMLKLFRSLAQE